MSNVCKFVAQCVIDGKVTAFRRLTCHELWTRYWNT